MGFSTPLPLSHFVTHPGTSPKVRHISRTPANFLVSIVQKSRTKEPCTNSLSIVRGVFVREVLSGVFCLEGFVWGCFCPFSLLLEHICYNRKLNITLNFMCHMYDKLFYKLDVTSYLLLPLSQTITASRSPSSVTYFMDGP